MALIIIIMVLQCTRVESRLQKSDSMEFPSIISDSIDSTSTNTINMYSATNQNATFFNRKVILHFLITKSNRKKRYLG